MHCPKCDQTYPEGSQRFCDVDGTRLISHSDDAYRRGKQSTFLSILPKAVADEPHGEAVDVAAARPVSEQSEQPAGETQAAASVENDEKEKARFITSSGTPVVIAAEPKDERIFGRKVNPYDIPAGHVDIDHAGERDHPSITDPDFDIDDPGAFVGRTVKGRYVVIDLIGEDDTGFAFLAEDRLIDDKLVQVRILTNEFLDEITESIFAEERVSLSHLNHPNLERLFDSGEFVDGTPFLISEHLDVLSAEDILYINGPLDAARAAKIIRQAGHALSDVHQEGILHRDLRPAYLMLANTDGDSELVKLTNFGASDGAPNSENLAYRAPEVLEGRIPTIAGDIYSLGVIAYRILTDRTPFPGESPKELLRYEHDGLRTLPTAIRVDLAPAVDHVFEKVLAADPLRRYATAREFGDALYLALTAAQPSETAVAEMPKSLLPEIPAGEILPYEPQYVDTFGSRPTSDVRGSMSSARFASPVWTSRYAEPVSEPMPAWTRLAAICIVILLVLAAAVWFYLS